MKFILTMLLIMSAKVSHAKNTCLSVLKESLNNIQACKLTVFDSDRYFDQEMNNGEKIFYILPSTTSTPIFGASCLSKRKNVKKSMQLIQEGIKMDGLFLRQVAEKYQIDIGQLSLRIQEFNSQPQNCYSNEYKPFNEIIEQLTNEPIN